MTPDEQEGNVYPGYQCIPEPDPPPIHKGKLQCSACGCHCEIYEVDFVQDPKKADNGWQICPHCRSASVLHPVCEFGECKKLVTCGSVFGEVYVHCCGGCLRKWETL